MISGLEVRSGKFSGIGYTNGMQLKIYSLYCITNLVNGKKYIGITIRKLNSRFNSHKNLAKKDNKRPLYSAMRKHGFKNFVIELLSLAQSWDQLCELEKKAIKDFNTFIDDGQGYNLTRGGEGTVGRKLSKEHLLKIKIAREQWSEEKRQEIRARQAVSLRKAWQQRDEKTRKSIGHNMSKSRKKMLARRSEEDQCLISSKISKSVKNYIASKTDKEKRKWVARQKVSVASRSEDRQREISETNRKSTILQHRNMTDDQKRTRSKKISSSNTNHPSLSKPCLIYGKKYPSIAEASRQTGISKVKLGRLIRSGKDQNFSGHPN